MGCLKYANLEQLTTIIIIREQNATNNAKWAVKNNRSPE